MTVWIRFTDHEGDPLALTNQISAVYVTSEKDQLMAYPGQVLREAKAEEHRVVVHATGIYRVRETFDEVMAKLAEADMAEAEFALE